MTKEEVLAKYFSEKKGFRDVQEETIDSLLAGKNTLCLMPTGGGKSLIYQVAGLCMEKTTIIISPLIALMNQQNAEMRAKGISTVSFSGMDYKKQFALITDMANGVNNSDKGSGNTLQLSSQATENKSKVHSI